MDLVADDRAARVHQGREPVRDLRAAHFDRADLEQIGHLRVTSRRLDVHDHELAAGLDGVEEVEHRVRGRFDERRDLRLADGLAELLLEVDQRLQGPVAEQDALGDDLLGQDLHARLDHHDRVARARDDQVELGLLELRRGRVDDELAADPADAHRADRALERDLADRQRRRRRDRPEHVGVVLLVRREHRDDDLDVVLVALGEERPDRPVRESSREDRRLGRARLALDEAARDLAGGVHPLLEVDREREEVQARAWIGAVGGAEHHRVAEANGDRATRQAGELAGLDGQRAAAELRLEGLRHGDMSLLAVAQEEVSVPWCDVGRSIRHIGSIPRLGAGPGAAIASGEGPGAR